MIRCSCILCCPFCCLLLYNSVHYVMLGLRLAAVLHYVFMCIWIQLTLRSFIRGTIIFYIWEKYSGVLNKVVCYLFYCLQSNIAGEDAKLNQIGHFTGQGVIKRLGYYSLNIHSLPYVCCCFHIVSINTHTVCQDVYEMFGNLFISF